MKKVRFAPCLAIMAAGLLAGSAAAQDFPGRAMVDDGNDGIDVFANRNFQVRTDVGDSYGYSNGYQTFGIFQPIILEPNESLFFVNPRGIVTFDSGHFAGSLGGGFRWMDPETERIWGVGGWYDHDSTGDYDYSQWGISLESLGNVWDFRANAYIPFNDGTNILKQGLTGNVFFVGNNIGLGRSTVFQSQLSGGDFEIGGAIFPGFSDIGFRTYAGGYYMQGEDTLGAGYGVKARIEALVTQNFIVNVGYSNDTFYDSNLTASLTWYLGSGEDAQWFKRMPQTNRLYQQMERNYRNMVLTHEVVDFIRAARAGGTGGSGGAIGTPIFVVHVDNTAAAGGDGSIERPLNQLPTSTGSNVDIILVETGTGTTARMNGGIVLNDWQRLLGDGMQHTFTSTQGTFVLPGFNPGAFPAITSTGGNAITLASHNEVAGFRVPNAGDSGIFGNNVTDFNIHDVTITNPGNEGIVIANASGTGLLTRVSATGAGDNGIHIGSTGTSVFDLITRNVTATGNGQNGLRIDTFGTATTTVDSRNDIYDSNDGSGILLSSADNSSLTAAFRTVSSNTNGVNGLEVRGANASSVTASVSGGFFGFGRSELSSNVRNGAFMALTDSSTGSLSITTTDLLGNGIDGVRLDLQDSSVADLSVTNSTITGGSVGLVFFIDGDTFSQPFAITNNTPVGGPDLDRFELNLAGTLVFDTANGASTPFAAVPPSDLTTGLQNVNGSTNPPGFVVPDNSQQLLMTFNDFNSTETFQWNIDIDPDPAFDGSIAGNDLIGSTVIATFSDGQILSGSLVAVAGNPQASTFVASSGLAGGTNVHVLASDSAQIRRANISNNTLTRAGVDGIGFEMSNNSTVGTGGITISNNTIDSNGTPTGDGIRFLLTDNAQIAANRLRMSTNTITNNDNGISLRAEDTAVLNALLTANIITDNALAGVSVSNSGATTMNVGITGDSRISDNGDEGVLFNMQGGTANAVIQGGNIDNNGRMGIAVTATDGTFNLFVGGGLLTERVSLDNNNGAGIAYNLRDTASGLLSINNVEITNTNALAGNPNLVGQAIDIRLTDSGIPATATATLNSLVIQDSDLGSDAFATDGNAGGGIVFFADNATTLASATITNNIIANNGGDGINFDRINQATINAVVISNNTIESNLGDGIEINARNDANDVNNYSLVNNEILNSGGVGVRLSIQADALLDVDMTNNVIDNSGSHGIFANEVINAPGDLRRLSGTWRANEITNSGGNGILINATVDNLQIGVANDGNTITDNNGSGIIINGAGIGEIVSNEIHRNNGAGVDLNITRSTIGTTNRWTIDDNGITNNALDGIEILNNQPQFDPANPGLLVNVTNNTIRDNRGRGIDVLNRLGSGGQSNLVINVTGNDIIENGEEGFYLVNTASGTQGQTARSDVALLADGSVLSSPRTILTFTDNTVTGNGVVVAGSQTINTTGLVVRVGTSDGGYGFTNPGGFFTSGRGGVSATVTDNTFGGNFGNDISYQSFTSTVDPTATAGTWDATTFTITSFSGDPLARLDLVQNNNVFDSAAVNNAGAFYIDQDTDFKSRDVGATDPGPFLSDTRERNAQRLGFRGTGVNQEPPFTPGGASDLFLYPGLGQSTFRVLGAFDAAAGFMFDTAIYNDSRDGNGVFSPTGAGFEIEATRYGWTLVP